MDTSQTIVLLIAFASLIVSIISMLYARRAHNLDLQKHKSYLEQQDVFINAQKSYEYVHKDTIILLAEVVISNQLSRHTIIRYFSFDLKFLKPIVGNYISKELTFRVKANNGVSWGESDILTFSKEDNAESLVKKYMGTIDSVVRDRKKKSKIDFLDGLILETVPNVYNWQVIITLPLSLVNEAEEEEYYLNELVFNMHLDDDITRKAVASLGSSFLELHRVDIEEKHLDILFE